MPDFTLTERFWSKVSKTESCWNWTGAKTADGYGNFSLVEDDRRVYRYAHRLAFMDAGNVIPAGLVIDHLCRNRACVNPAHLEAVTNRTNNLRGESPAARQFMQTHCVNGHAFNEKNTYRWPKDPGHRTCRACGRIRALQKRRERKAARESSHHLA